jgi:dipeptidase E
MTSLDSSPSDTDVAIITTASAEWKEQNKHAIEAYNFFKRDGFRRIQFVDIEKEVSDVLREFKIIYLSGGDPYYLLHQLRVSGADNALISLHAEGSILIGISAGGMVLGPDIGFVDRVGPPSPHAVYPERKGLGLFHFQVLYHANRYTDQIGAIRSEVQEDLLELSDDQVLLLKDGKREFVK